MNDSWDRLVIGPACVSAPLPAHYAADWLQMAQINLTQNSLLSLEFVCNKAEFVKRAVIQRWCWMTSLIRLIPSGAWICPEYFTDIYSSFVQKQHLVWWRKWREHEGIIQRHWDSLSDDHDRSPTPHLSHCKQASDCKEILKRRLDEQSDHWNNALILFGSSIMHAVETQVNSSPSNKTSFQSKAIDAFLQICFLLVCQSKEIHEFMNDNSQVLQYEHL